MNVEAMRSVPLFRGLKERQLEQILALGKEVHHAAGKAVVEEDHPGIGFHLIVSGEAEASIGGLGVSKMGPGDYFGEISLIDGGLRSATVTASSDLTTFGIPAWNFSQLLDTSPEIARALLLELCGRIRHMSEALHTA